MRCERPALRLSGVRLSFHEAGNRKLGKGMGQVPDRVLIFLVQSPITDEDFLFALAEVIGPGRGPPAGHYIKDIDPFCRHPGQVIRLGHTVSIFISALGIGFHAANFTKFFLRQPQAFPFLS